MNPQMMQMANAMMQNATPQNLNSQLINALMNPQFREQQLNNFQQQMCSQFQQFNPYAFAQQALASGQMTQEQFAQYRAQANQIMGTNY